MQGHARNVGSPDALFISASGRHRIKMGHYKEPYDVGAPLDSFEIEGFSTRGLELLFILF